MSIKLTKSIVDRLRFDPKGASQQIHWDERLKGFGVRVFESGTKSFVVGYRIAGRWRLFTVGPYGVLTVDQARNKAEVLLVGTRLEGQDPAAEKHRNLEEATMANLCSAYIERHAKPNKKPKSWKEDQRLIDRYILPKWGTRKVSQLTRKEI